MKKFFSFIYKHKKDKNISEHKLFGLTVFKIAKDTNYRNKYICGICFSKKRILEYQINRSFSGLKFDNNTFKFGIKLKGGLGDILIGINYLTHILKIFPKSNYTVDIFAHRNVALVRSLLPKNVVIHSVNIDEAIPDNGNDKYDLFLVLNRYPDILERKMNRIFSFSSKLIDFVHICEKWRLEHIRIYDHLPICDGESNYISEILNKKRIQQPDIYNFFDVKEVFSYELNIDDVALKKFNHLNLHKFITVHRGVDDRQVKNSIKLWPLDFYNVLIKLIKSDFPNIHIVQLGINSERCPEFDCIDTNLVGSTTIEDMKVLLKHSLLHIDCEGGLVHLRHALNGGKSVVFFGPTSPAFYGYNENINFRGNGCPEPCEWIINQWQSSCCRGYSRPPCMFSLTPELVYRNIKSALEEINELYY